MNPHFDFDDIDDYVHDRMSASDRTAFEQALETDAELARRVEALRAEGKVLRLLRDERLMAQFEAWDKEAASEKKIETEAKPPVFSNARMALVVAVLLGITVAAILFKWPGCFAEKPTETSPAPNSGKTETSPQQSPSDRQDVAQPTPQPDTPQPENKNQSPPSDRYAALAKRYYAGGDEFRETLSGRNDGEKSRLAQAVDLYEVGRYQEALPLLLQPDNVRLQEYLFLRAHTYYHLGRYPDALLDFRSFRQYEKSDYTYEAQWGEVLCLLHQMPASESDLRALLRPMISDIEHPYHKKAAGVVREIGN
ncbi:MAG: hypothetical protein ABMA02_09380 [Saprospiraceae bacterium]